jgi:hypothetical protein
MHARRTSEAVFQGNRRRGLFEFRPKAMRMRRSCLVASITAVLLLACSVRREAARTPEASTNPIAICEGKDTGVAMNASCLSLRLSSIDAEGDKEHARVDGALVVRNRCDTAIAVLSAPTDTRQPTVAAWEESLSSTYARFDVFETVPGTEPLDDRGVPVHSLPSFVVVPSGTEKTFPIRGGSARLAGLSSRKHYFARFCTFVAPTNRETQSSSVEVSIDQSIEVFESAASKPCAARRRLSTTLVCTPSVPLAIDAVTLFKPFGRLRAPAPPIPCDVLTKAKRRT